MHIFKLYLFNLISVIFFFYTSAPTYIYTLSLHDALPISFRGERIRCAVSTRLSSSPAGTSATASCPRANWRDRKSTRLNSSHITNSYAVFCLKKKKKKQCL